MKDPLANNPDPPSSKQESPGGKKGPKGGEQDTAGVNQGPKGSKKGPNEGIIAPKVGEQDSPVGKKDPRGKMAVSSGGMQNTHVEKQDSSAGLPIGVSGVATECEVLKPREVKVTPTWTASFPGSGIKILWKAVQGITGIFTGDDNDASGQMKKGVVITVKTHFPSIHVSVRFQRMVVCMMKFTSHCSLYLLRRPYSLNSLFWTSLHSRQPFF